MFKDIFAPRKNRLVVNYNKSPSTPGATVSFDDVSYSYPKRSKIFEAQNLIIEPSSFITIVGPSGCGKTTLLKLIAKLINPTHGSVKTLNQATQPLLAREIAFVFQKPNLLRWLLTKQNVELPGVLWNDNEVHNRAEAALDSVGLIHKANSFPYQLSVGEQSRVALARAWCQEPKLLLLDEPFAAVDEVNRTKLNQKLLELWEGQKFTTIFVTHSIYEAVFLADRVIVLGPAQQGIIDDITVPLQRPRDTKVYDDRNYLEIVKKIRGKLNYACGSN